MNRLSSQQCLAKALIYCIRFGSTQILMAMKRERVETRRLPWGARCTHMHVHARTHARTHIWAHFTVFHALIKVAAGKLGSSHLYILKYVSKTSVGLAGFSMNLPCLGCTLFLILDLLIQFTCSGSMAKSAQSNS